MYYYRIFRNINMFQCQQKLLILFLNQTLSKINTQSHKINYISDGISHDYPFNFKESHTIDTTKV